VWLTSAVVVAAQLLRVEVKVFVTLWGAEAETEEWDVGWLLLLFLFLML
jgi:hypothetical protein